MTKNSRRNFIRNSALTGVATYFIPSFKTSASTQNNTTKLNLRENAVILFQGDSITDGNRGRSADPNHIMGHGYAFSIASRVGADFPEKRYLFYNRGISGNKITDLENRWQTDTIDLKPDILSILVGVNDASSIVFNRPPVVSVDQYEKTYNALLEQTKATFPGMLLVLCEPFILAVGKVQENWEAYHSDIVQRQAIVQKLATKFDAVFVGFQDVFDKASEKAPADYWIWDGVHPTVAGHELMAREWLKQIEARITF